MSQTRSSKLKKQQKYYLNKSRFNKGSLALYLFIKESSNVGFTDKYNDSPLDCCIWDWILDHARKAPLSPIQTSSLQKILFSDVVYLYSRNKNPILNILIFIKELQHYLQQSPFNLTSKVIVRNNRTVILVIGQ